MAQAQCRECGKWFRYADGEEDDICDACWEHREEIEEDEENNA